MRAKWDEKAKRLAKEHNMVGEIENNLLFRKGNCCGMGIEAPDGRWIRWSLNEGEIVVEVKPYG